MIKIRIPASCANLGSGFDSLGIALDLYNYIEMEEAEGCFISSKDSSDIPLDENNLIYFSAKKVYEKLCVPFKGLRIIEENNIPFARGLGSSSACIIGGIFGTNALLGYPLSNDELLEIALEIEGHPDNISPALLGGFTVNAVSNGKVYYVKQELLKDLTFVAFVPSFELKTADARAVIPKEISIQDSVFNLSRSALLASSLISCKFENLKIGAEDRLHQPYRLHLINGGEEIIEDCYKKGAVAAFISGAGSTMMAIFDDKKENVAVSVQKILSRKEFFDWNYFLLSVDNEGAKHI